MIITRRDLMKFGFGAAALAAWPRLARAAAAAAASGPVITKAIPSSGEKVPVVGIGTRTYEPGMAAIVQEILRLMPGLRGKVVDTAAGYGESEVVIGDAVNANRNRGELFLATKMSRGKDEAEACFRRLKTDRIDAINVWNLGNPDANLGILKDLKAAGRVKYIGVTTSSDNQYAQLEQIMRAQPLDFVQVDYALNNRNVADRLLPLAADRKMGVMVNLPFGRTSLFTAIGTTRPLPDWAKEIQCTTWAQVALKYVVSHPAVTVAIPGTGQVRHLEDNMQANHGTLPDAAMRRRIEQFFDAL